MQPRLPVQLALCRRRPHIAYPIPQRPVPAHDNTTAQRRSEPSRRATARTMRNACEGKRAARMDEQAPGAAERMCRRAVVGMGTCGGARRRDADRRCDAVRVKVEVPWKWHEGGFTAVSARRRWRVCRHGDGLPPCARLSRSPGREAARSQLADSNAQLWTGQHPTGSRHLFQVAIQERTLTYSMRSTSAPLMLLKLICSPSSPVVVARVECP